MVICLCCSKVALADNSTEIFISDRSARALTHVRAGLSEDELDQFALGRSFFTIPWVQAPAATTARDGLGPLFSANSCVSCHPNNSGGSAISEAGLIDRSIVIRLSRAPTSGALPQDLLPDPVYGAQLSINGSIEVPFEAQVQVTLKSQRLTYNDGASVTLNTPEFHLNHFNYGPLDSRTRLHPRRALSLVGMGLIEKIPEQQILAREDIEDNDGDGISGKVNRVWSVEQQRLRPGRYGWKASLSSLLEQTAHALNHDMGLTSDLFPESSCSLHQVACTTAASGGQPEVPMSRLQAIRFYLAQLRLPRPDSAQALEGEHLFRSVGCIRCHQTGFKTPDGLTLDPYSDFLLHDMGPQLADDSQVYLAEAAEWRTPPLWGIGLARVLNPKAGYLHDGRAQTLEQAILWHGGEAEASQQAFMSLPVDQRSALIIFLQSL